MKKDEAYDVTSSIAEMTSGIVLASYNPKEKSKESYQTEAQLEEDFIARLTSQGYERFKGRTSKELYANLKIQIEKLNNFKFTNDEWERFLSEYLDRKTDTVTDKTRKVQEDYIYDFVDDKGQIRNIKILDKKNIYNNFLQVTSQIYQEGIKKNKYDTTVLVNGLPLVHIELKRRGENLQEAFNQIQRYEKESFYENSSLYKYVQIFVISNGTLTKYFSNTTVGDKKNYAFTIEWADSKNKTINDLEDFAATFFEKRTVLEILIKYCVFNCENKLLVMRPYQIAATERILWKIQSSFQNRTAGKIDAGGFIWHTTGSGKTLTSFKTAKLATELEYIDKVFFVVDRKDLDYQTMKEYQNFQKDSVNGSKSTTELKRNIEKKDNRIVVTTIQKLNEFIKRYNSHPVSQKHCVIIYDECHRSMFGEAQRNIRKFFKKYYQFGFTGTPIFEANALQKEVTTPSVFGANLHSYIITDAIRDKKVLKFKVDYNAINPEFTEAENMENENITVPEKLLLLHPKRISEVADHILKVFDQKTNRNTSLDLELKRKKGFNAMFAVQSIDAAKLYYNEIKRKQKSFPENKRLRVATIFSFRENEEISAIGEIEDESLETAGIDLTSKEFLEKAMKDYNRIFKTNFSIEGQEFQNYYKDISKRMKSREIDLLIVVGMFLTGFDAPCLNTLFVDKNLKFHGLLQAFSRTNRILNESKTFGNIVCFRNLEKATEEAIRVFGSSEGVKIALEKSFDEYINGFTDETTGRTVKGYREICNEIKEKFPVPVEISSEAEKKEFVEIFGEFLKSESILKNFDEFETFERIISDREKQDLKSIYIDICEEIRAIRDSGENISIDFADIHFHLELLKTEEINIDYILGLILKKSKEIEDIEKMKEEVKKIIRANIGTRAKEELVMKFIDETEISVLKSEADIIEAFYNFASSEKEKEIQEIIKTENLKEGAKRIIVLMIKLEETNIFGTELDAVLPAVSRRKGARKLKKDQVLEKIRKAIEIFSGI